MVVKFNNVNLNSLEQYVAQGQSTLHKKGSVLTYISPESILF